MTELDQLRRLVEARAEVAKPRPYPATTPLALDRMGLGDACLDTDLPAILSAMQQAAATIAEAKILIDRRDKEIAYRSDVAAQLQRDNEAKQLHIAAQAAEIERLSKLLGLHRDEINRISAAIATGNSPYPINTGLMLELAAREGK